ncbi:MAG: PfkB family carbohydrate kinase [Bacteroidota bacterium]
MIIIPGPFCCPGISDTSGGDEGTMLITADIEQNIIPPQVKRKSTVGAGDSTVAGIVLALPDGNDLENCRTLWGSLWYGSNNESRNRIVQKKKTLKDCSKF